MNSLSIHSTSNADDLVSTAAKLRFLLGLSGKSSVLLIGEFCNEYLEDLEKIFGYVCRYDCWIDFTEDISDERMFDLVIFDGRRNSRVLDRFSKIIRSVNRFIKPAGIVLIFSHNRYELSAIKSNLNGKSSLKGLLPWDIKRISKAAGFGFIREFSLAPDVYMPEEYVSTECGSVELRADVRWIVKLLNYLGLHRFLHGGYFYIIARGSDNSCLQQLKTVFMLLPEGELPPDQDIKLERFYLRNRGSLLLVLLNNATCTKYLARIATSRKINSVLSRNREAVDRIHNLPEIAPEIRMKIPRIVDKRDLNGANIYIEEYKTCVIAWKLRRDPALDRVIYSNAFEFIYKFNLGTRKQQTVTDQLFDKIIGHDLDRLGKAFAENNYQVIWVNRVRDLLYSWFSGRQITVVIGHGDYGPGNILCDEKSGALLAVIDWDTYVGKELPGVDFLNYRLQQLRNAREWDLVAAIGDLYQELAGREYPDTRMPGYNESDFGITCKDLIAYLCITVIRFARRSVPYRKEFLDLLDETVMQSRQSTGY